MIKQLYIICLVLVLMAFSSCEKEETNYYTTAITRLEISEGEELMQMQGEGTVRVKMADGSVSVRYFRVSESYVEVLNNSTTIVLHPIWL